MSRTLKFKKGLDIKLAGKAKAEKIKVGNAVFYAVKPTDFHGLTPKLAVKVEHSVKAGTPLFFDKYNPEIKFVSPVSGTVVAINRGDRRKLLEVVVKADSENVYEEFSTISEKSNSEEIKACLLKSGIWPSIKQRPYDVIANADDTPKCIYISCFDSAPLAPNYEYTLKGEEKYFQAAVNVLNKLTTGGVYLGLDASDKGDSIFKGIKNVEVNYFSGKHPIGNAGVQLHHVNPVNKGEKVWTIRPQDVVILGRLILDAKYDARKVVALTGSELKETAYCEMISGANITDVLKPRLKNEVNQRIISGNVLTGSAIAEDSYLGYYDAQITVIPEGDNSEFFGWMLPGFNKFSASKTFFSSLLPKKEYTLDANFNGEPRAFVISEQYESVLPMDVLPVFLLKAILVDDIDKMEQLGLYEVAAEDMAICEYVCTSKTQVQDIMWRGIDLMIKELGQ
jgi:Na+-transporting NADH:ubiquinone oxidoreductase subunit A